MPIGGLEVLGREKHPFEPMHGPARHDSPISCLDGRSEVTDHGRGERSPYPSALAIDTYITLKLTCGKVTQWPSVPFRFLALASTDNRDTGPAVARHAQSVGTVTSVRSVDGRRITVPGMGERP